MSKPLTHNKPNILHLLEYCRIDRAAELLGCEMSDLLHLEEIDAIDLYWNFKFQPATTNLGPLVPMVDCQCEDAEIEADSPQSIYASAIYPVEENGETTYSADPQINTNTWFGVPVLLDGLWHAGDRLTPHFIQNMEPSGRFLCRAETNEGDIIAALPPEWKEPPVEELCIMRRDLLRLSKAIYEGQPLDGRDYNHEQHGCRSHHKATESRQILDTRNACLALVEVLKASGFTDEDFKGSIRKLQTKISSRCFGGMLTSVDEKTLADWLRKAGVR